MEYYWEIVRKDGTTVEVLPSAVDIVRKRWDEKKAIHFRNFSVQPFDIADFRQTTKPYGQPLLEAAAQAFREPVVNPDGSMACRWVKKSVTQAEWGKYYSNIPSYKKLSNEDNFVVVAFRKPIHEIDTAKVTYCTDEEEASLWHSVRQRD